MNQKYITCKRVKFFCKLDEDMFFAWIKNISCIEKFEGAHDELYLDLIDQELTCEDMTNLIALLHRYKINMKQLQSLITVNNEAAIKSWKKQILKK